MFEEQYKMTTSRQFFDIMHKKTQQENQTISNKENAMKTDVYICVYLKKWKLGLIIQSNNISFN